MHSLTTRKSNKISQIYYYKTSPDSRHVSPCLQSNVCMQMSASIWCRDLVGGIFREKTQALIYLSLTSSAHSLEYPTPEDIRVQQLAKDQDQVQQTIEESSEILEQQEVPNFHANIS